MSRAAEWSRLLRHASQRLAEEDKTVVDKFMAVHRASTEEVGSDKRRLHGAAAMTDLASYTAAVTEARLVMDTLAAFLVDDEEAGDD